MVENYKLKCNRYFAKFTYVFLKQRNIPLTEKILTSVQILSQKPENDSPTLDQSSESNHDKNPKFAANIPATAAPTFDAPISGNTSSVPIILDTMPAAADSSAQILLAASKPDMSISGSIGVDIGSIAAIRLSRMSFNGCTKSPREFLIDESISSNLPNSSLGICMFKDMACNDI